MMPTYSRYEEQRAVIRLSEEVSNASIFSLCDEIDLAIDYYKYSEIEIQIDSPGGAVSALEFYLTRLNQWRINGVRISTTALTQVASAAAMILALGDIGYRRAYASSELLFHNARVQIGRPLTAADMDRHSGVMQRLDQRLYEKLADHLLTHPDLRRGNRVIYPAKNVDSLWPACPRSVGDLFTAKEYPGGIDREKLLAQLKQLSEIDRFISPENAQAFYLIDHIEA